MSKILIVDDDIASCRTLQLHLGTQGHQVQTAHSVDDGLAAAQQEVPELVILDIRMPGKSGLEGLPEFKRRFPHTHIIMITAFHDMDSTIDAMQKGAEDYIHKPIDIDELEGSIDKICRPIKPEEQLLAANSQDGANPLSMVGRSRAMKEVFKTIGLVAKSPATVLITGESGTGKELVARAIHRASNRPNGPFVAINCAALVDTLLESDMFGHEKGSFTGATGQQEGKFALTHGGSIFLDEIGEMSPTMRAKLLRVLQYKEFTPLGAKKAQTTDARIIAATNIDLSANVADGSFREDLFYRLQVINIHLPPLRERKEDLMDLIQTLLCRINKELHRNVSHIAKDILGCFESYHWPGNVRELENILMKAVALSTGDTITQSHLPIGVCSNPACNSSLESLNEKPADTWSLEEMEQIHITRVLEACNWHKGHACDILGISRPRLRRMIKQYRLAEPVDISDIEENNDTENAGHSH